MCFHILCVVALIALILKMNLEYFDEALRLISFSGTTLGPEQKTVIETSLTVLQNEQKLANMFFWGRISGIDDDYYIAFGYTKDGLRQRRFFYSTNGYQWLLLPEANPDLYEASLVCTEMFNGDSTTYVDVTLDPKFTIDENQLIYATKPEIVKIKEEDRLACTVQMITEESALVPHGALYKQTDQSYIHSPLFHGLSDIEAVDLVNYQLYREPKFKWNHNLLQRVNYKYTIDCLDTPQDAIPDENGFSLTLENNGRVVLIKSLLWLGMSFFHKIQSRKHGFAYFGNGKKNFDLLFMLDEVK